MKIFYLVFSIIIFYSSTFFACPTCEGKIKPESPLFFSEEFYKPGNGNSVSRITKEQIGIDELKKLVEQKREKQK
jgi:hypothetical protein